MLISANNMWGMLNEEVANRTPGSQIEPVTYKWLWRGFDVEFLAQDCYWEATFDGVHTIAATKRSRTSIWETYWKSPVPPKEFFMKVKLHG